MQAKIQIEDNEFTVHYSYLGFEKYYLNGELVRKGWNFQFRGTREFTVGEHQLKIDVCVLPNSYHCKAYLDDDLYVEELFPEFRDRFIKAKAKRKSSPTKMVFLTIIWAAICFTMFQYFQS
jgi:hypothetical protein